MSTICIAIIVNHNSMMNNTSYILYYYHIPWGIELDLIIIWKKSFFKRFSRIPNSLLKYLSPSWMPPQTQKSISPWVCQNVWPEIHHCGEGSVEKTLYSNLLYIVYSLCGFPDRFLVSGFSTALDLIIM